MRRWLAAKRPPEVERLLDRPEDEPISTLLDPAAVQRDVLTLFEPSHPSWTLGWTLVVLNAWLHRQAGRTHLDHIHTEHTSA